MSRVVIVGAGHAAAEAISSLRKKGYEGEILLIGDEPLLPYQRPPLSKKYLLGEVSLQQLYIKGPDTYDAAGVVQMLGRTVLSVNRQTQQLALDGDETVSYDKLILATGTRVRTLPVEGSDLPQIMYLRSKHDADRIRSALRPGAKMLIVGGGYIGLEIAASAIQIGVKVIVIEAMDRVLQRVTSPVVSEFYQSVHQQEGVEIRLSAALVKFSAAAGHHAVLQNGDTIEFDAAVIGIGVIPNVELASEAGLPCENGIVVDEFCKTTDPNIYAVGDCCIHPSTIYNRRLRLESVPNAMGQARTAVASICGEQQPYDEVPWFWSDQYDVKLQTVGLCEGYDELVVRGDQSERKFAVFYLQEKRLIATDAINSPAEFMVSKKLVAARAHPDPEQLANPDVALKTLL